MWSFCYIIPPETKKKNRARPSKCFIFNPDGGSIDAVRGPVYCLMSDSGGHPARA